MSKRKFYYDSVGDSQARLSGTVVTCRGEPCFVHSVQGLNTNQIAQVTFLPYNPRSKEFKIEEIPLTRENFEVNRLPQLGYVNGKNFAYYLSRRPVRGIKQGLCRGNVDIPNPYDGPAPNFETLISKKEFVDMLLGKYEAFRNVFDHVVYSDEMTTKAFNKQYALELDEMESVTLNYRGLKVARANNPRKVGPVFKLPKQFHYLAEELQENGIRIE